MTDSKHFWDEWKRNIRGSLAGSVVIYHQSEQTQWEIYSTSSAACGLICEAGLDYFLSSYVRLMLTSQQIKLGSVFLYFIIDWRSWNSPLINFLWKMPSSVQDRDKISEQAYLTESRCSHIRLATKHVYLQFLLKGIIFLFCFIRMIA